MDIIIKEIHYRINNRNYLINVIYDGEFYTACGYLNGELINETRISHNGSGELLNPDSPEIENLVYLIKEDINEGND
ncbi:MAG: hypothetical protein MUE56_01090 [Ignavibacteria bacterium]|jgi:hypothetical protein|nr:hypothetical protein [Ignavibacteria bacterium]